ncbi:hypothetical protein GOP47_0024125 [Adiantum capillus-veneris]|uniref:J domain-containing protein n=1 Tax=Adiantum capillus-veneris TaxID=13818 RepID=A0A9D4U5T9_ADICA|nr:hypothetical protein GOP47_0024125 [Adiantum capillus-veneris]
MDCNREEAIRVRALAEAKLASQDYMLAKKYALKAQQLFPGLENMVQIMAVIDVHMAALVKIAGCNELDWYGILQVEPNADEAAVKKQYRKLALFLHPDKNKFAGAEAAFKLIGEASQVLSDKIRRSVYNAKRGLAQKRANPLTPSRNQRACNKQNHQQPNMQNVAPRQSDQLHPFTFWTACPFCHMRYQYLRKFEDKNLLCLHCRRAFIAKDLLRVNPTQAPPSGMQQPKHPTAGLNAFANGRCNATHPNNTAQAASAPKAGSVPVTHAQNGYKPVHKEETEKELQRKAHDLQSCMERQNEQAKQNGAKVAQKEEVKKEFGKKAHEFLKSMDKEQANQNGTKASQKQEVESELHRRAHEFLKSMELEKEQLKQQKEQVKYVNATNKCAANSFQSNYFVGREQQRRAEELHEPEVLQGAEDYLVWREQQRRAEELHKAEVLQRAQELRRSTELQKELEKQREHLGNTSATEQSKPIPTTEGKEKVVQKEHAGVPLKANKKQGKKHQESSSSETEEDEKDWKEVAVNWKNEGLPRRSSRSKRNVTYDCGDSDDDFQHVPPSKKARIDEVGGPEQGTKTLTTPQKLANFAKQAIRVKLNMEKTTAFTVEDEAQGPQEQRGLEKRSESGGMKGFSVSSCNIPDAEFFNFDNGREEKDVEAGQIWALYDDTDGMPRYYMRVKDVHFKPFKVSAGWFEVRKPSEEQFELLDLGYSFTCGEFRMSSSQVMHSVNSFSHLVKWEKLGKSMIKVYPKKGEIWCLYEEWKEGQQLLKASDSPSKYCIVEVLTDCSEVSGVSMMLLKRVEGFKTIYRLAHGQALEVPFLEILRFSHQVPAHKLSGNEAPNAPKDCWELDPAALPSNLMQPDAVA